MLKIYTQLTRLRALACASAENTESRLKRCLRSTPRDGKLCTKSQVELAYGAFRKYKNKSKPLAASQTPRKAHKLLKLLPVAKLSLQQYWATRREELRRSVRELRSLFPLDI